MNEIIQNPFQVAKGDVMVEKVKTDENLADLFTKFKAWEEINKHLGLTYVSLGGDRNPNMPSVSK